MKKIYGGMMLSAFALTMAMAITPVSASAAEGVQINEENFPDSTFRIYVSEMYDRDGNGTLNTEEIDAATKCSVANFEISDLKGLQFFTALTELDCSGNKLTSLDVSKNTALTKLECSGNQLFSLDVNNNTALTRLDCSYTRLVSLDISQNTALTYLQCNNNQLTSLDISNNTALTDLQCSWNRIASLDTSKNRNLTFLECTSNYNLTSLDISQNTALTELICNKNKLTSLDTSKNTALKYLSCDTNQLTSLDVSKNTALKALSCNSNQLTSLDVSNNSALVYIICEKNQLSFLDLSKNTELVNLFCSKNKLTSLDLSNTKVSTFYCSPNVSTIIMDNNRTFDLSILPGFDVSKASNWTGGTVSGSFLTVNSDAAEVTCTYDCGRNYSGTFTFNITNEPIITNHPTDVSVPIGSKASVSIAATDSGQKYTWYYKDVDSSSFSKSSNTSSTYSATMCAALNGRQV